MKRVHILSCLFFLVTAGSVFAMKTPLEPLKVEENQLRSPTGRRVLESRRDRSLMLKFEKDRIFFLMDSWLSRSANVG